LVALHLLLIDGLNFVRRLFAAIVNDKVEDPALSKQFQEVCGKSLQRALHDHQPTHVLCVFDSSAKNWRHHLFPEYKANRKPMPESLRQILPELKQDFLGHDVHSFSLDDCEADDVIASIVSRISGETGAVTLLSTDKSMCQLLQTHVQVYDHFNHRYLDESWVRQRFGVESKFLDTFFALAGDRSLNIPGVSGIGQHTAGKLVNDWGDLDAILSHVDDIPGKVGQALKRERQAALLARRLVRFKSDLQLGINLKDYRMPRLQEPDSS